MRLRRIIQHFMKGIQNQHMHCGRLSEQPTPIIYTCTAFESLEFTGFKVHHPNVQYNVLQRSHELQMCWVLLKVVLPVFSILEFAHEAVRKATLHELLDIERGQQDWSGRPTCSPSGDVSRPPP